jgi:hypothetical protein
MTVAKEMAMAVAEANRDCRAGAGNEGKKEGREGSKRSGDGQASARHRAAGSQQEQEEVGR